MRLHLGRFIFFAPPLVRVQFKLGRPSFLCFFLKDSFPIVFTPEHLALPFLSLNIYQMS